MKKKRLPKRVQRIIRALVRGQILCKSLRQKTTGETEIKFYYEPAGRSVGTKSAQDAIASGLLSENGDGLFSGLSQTWIARPLAEAELRAVA